MESKFHKNEEQKRGRDFGKRRRKQKIKQRKVEEMSNTFSRNMRENSQKKKHQRNQDFLKSSFPKIFLQKVGGILLFWECFSCYNWSTQKLVLWGNYWLVLALGLLFMELGFLEMKKFSKESRALLGTAIVINYLVILAGRYLIGETFTHNMIFSEGLTFLLLICNTIFLPL